jgi:hypothetical protein
MSLIEQKRGGYANGIARGVFKDFGIYEYSESGVQQVTDLVLGVIDRIFDHVEKETMFFVNYHSLIRNSIILTFCTTQNHDINIFEEMVADKVLEHIHSLYMDDGINVNSAVYNLKEDVDVWFAKKAEFNIQFNRGFGNRAISSSSRIPRA